MAKVLVIEDSVSQAAIISSIVSSAGYETVVCTDVSKGVGQIIKPINPDIVLLDLVLCAADGKVMADGFQVCKEIKRVSKNRIAVVVVSSKGDAESAEWAILQGADAFLQKPFAEKDLLKVIGEVLNRAAAVKI